MIIIPSKDRAETITTHLYCKGEDYMIVVHNKEQRDLYLNNPSIPVDRIMFSNEPYNISLQRQWILDNLIRDGEWFVTMDDNVTGMTRLQHPYYPYPLNLKTERSYWQQIVPIKEFLELIELDIAVAEQAGAHYIGYAVVDNPFFRQKKYRYVGYVLSKVALIHKTSLQRYDPQVKSMDDYQFTAENLKNYGKVVINNYIKPTAKHYQPGGIGTYEERTPQKIHDAAYLRNKYPGLFNYKIKKGCHPKAELQVKFTTRVQVEKWRAMLKSFSHPPQQPTQSINHKT